MVGRDYREGHMMREPRLTRRTAIAGLMSGFATFAAAAFAPRRAWALEPPGISASDGVIGLEFDSGLNSRVSKQGQPITPLEASEGVRLADGRVLDRFILLDHRHESRGEGEWYSL